MSVEAFLDPAGEAVQGLENTSSIEEEIAVQFDIQEDYEPEEELKESIASFSSTRSSSQRTFQSQSWSKLNQHKLVLQERTHRSLRQALIPSLHSINNCQGSLYTAITSL